MFLSTPLLPWNGALVPGCEKSPTEYTLICHLAFCKKFQALLCDVCWKRVSAPIPLRRGPILKNMAAAALYVDMIKRRTQLRRCSVLVCSLDLFRSML
jgi:hypothetical protein